MLARGAGLIPNSIGPILVALTLTVIGAIVAESDVGVLRVRPAAGAPTARRSATWCCCRVVGCDPRATGGWWCSRVERSCSSPICINFIGDGLRDAFRPQDG